MIGFKTDFKGSPMMRFQAGAPRMHNLVKSQTFWTMVIAAVAPFARRRRRGRLHANDPAQSRGLQRADLGAHGTSTLQERTDSSPQEDLLIASRTRCSMTRRQDPFTTRHPLGVSQWTDGLQAEVDP